MKLSIVQKLSLSTIVLVLISAGVVGGLFYTRTTTLLVENALKDITEEASNAGNILQVHIEAQQADVLFLSNTPPIQGMLRARNADNYDSQGRSTYRQWERRLQSIFTTILNSKSTYLKLRFIDTNGQELVVVGREEEKIVVLSGAQLQNKAHRAYVSSSLKLAAGAVYLSEINLNREHGEVSEPHLEVLRSATPVYDESNGEVAGLLLITAEIGQELRSIQNSIHSEGREIYISNDRGGYLLHPDASKAYGFDLGKRYRMQEDLPQLAQQFLPGNLEMHVTLRPDTSDGRSVVTLSKIPFDATHPERFIAVTMTQDYASIVAEQSAVLDDLKLWALFLALGGVGIAIIFSFRILRPIKEMTQAVDDFTHQRPTTASLPVTSGDEIGVLARSFKAMIQQVEESQNKLRELNDNLESQVTERTRSLQETERRFAFAVDGAGDGVWDWNMSTNAMQFSKLYMAMLGYAEDELPQHVDTWLNSVHPDDMAQVQQNLKDYLDGQLAKYSVELRLRCKDDHFKWVLCRGTVVEYDLEGNPLRMIGIHSDITHRKEVENALIDARDEAQSANRAKSEFLSSMSHELRTPMNAIMGFSQLMTINKKHPLNQAQQKNVDEIYKAGKHLLELINEVLDLARIEAGRVDLSIEAVGLAEVIDESLQLIKPLAQKAGIEISLFHNDTKIELDELLQQDTAVRADRTRLKQVLLNLLSNAIKYNSENGKLIISFRSVENNQTRISVTDTGSGLSDEQQKELFTAFNRLGADELKIEGTGIGLVITKNLVELMGGNIGMDSQLGEGSTFWIELPNDTMRSSQIEIPDTGSSENQQRVTDFEREHTVLYIEDNPANLRLVAQTLSSRPNIHMWSAHDPHLGIELATEHRPDLILLDINLPGMDGFEVLKELRQREATHNTPIIAISANAMPGDIKKGLEAGFDIYITKPIDVEILLETIDTKLAEMSK